MATQILTQERALRTWTDDESPVIRHPLSHLHRVLRKSVFSPFYQSKGVSEPFDGKANEKTSYHASRSLRLNHSKFSFFQIWDFNRKKLPPK